jgi:hypothetical protein
MSVRRIIPEAEAIRPRDRSESTSGAKTSSRRRRSVGADPTEEEHMIATRESFASPTPADRWRQVVVGAALLLAGLALIKFIVIKPIFFLFLSLLYVAGIVLIRRRRVAGAATLALLNVLVVVFFAAHFLREGLGVPNETTDAVVVLVGLPAAVVGLVGSVLTLRRERGRAQPA